MDLRKLKTLIDLVSESNVSELEITEAEGKVRIVKGSPAGMAAPVTYAMAPAVAAPMAAPAAPVAAQKSVDLEALAGRDSSLARTLRMALKAPRSL